MSARTIRAMLAKGCPTAKAVAARALYGAADRAPAHPGEPMIPLEGRLYVNPVAHRAAYYWRDPSARRLGA